VTLDCWHVRDVMDSFLSEELSVETNHGVLRHVAECRDCAAELAGRRRLRTLLADTGDLALDAERARARIVDAVDREQRSWARAARLGAVAATLVAAVAVAYWAGRPVDAAAYDDAAEDHVACALTYAEGTVYDPDLSARNLEDPFRQMADAVGLQHGDYHVIDAHMCPYKGRSYAHLVIRGQSQTLSLFAERAERGALPDAPVSLLAGDTIDVHATTRLGYLVSAVATRDHRLFVVSERPTDPPDIAHDILRSAVRFVRGLEK
jgi:hypothetical protein